MDKPKTQTRLAQQNAFIDPDLRHRLKVKLAADGLHYNSWLCARIGEYLLDSIDSRGPAPKVGGPRAKKPQPRSVRT